MGLPDAPQSAGQANYLVDIYMRNFDTHAACDMLHPLSSSLTQAWAGSWHKGIVCPAHSSRNVKAPAIQCSVLVCLCIWSSSCKEPWLRCLCLFYVCLAGKGAAVSRELEGKLYAGHETFDWLLGIISYIMSAEVCVSAACIYICSNIVGSCSSSQDSSEACRQCLMADVAAAVHQQCIQQCVHVTGDRITVVDRKPA